MAGVEAMRAEPFCGVSGQRTERTAGVGNDGQVVGERVEQGVELLQRDVAGAWEMALSELLGGAHVEQDQTALIEPLAQRCGVDGFKRVPRVSNMVNQLKLCF